ncbi:MAG: hypothetical protein R2828_33940 [Saprospiraceae bacterium]
MNKKKCVLLACFLLSNLFAFSQGATLYNSNNEVLTEKRYNNTQGTPYFYKDWSKGTLYDIKDQPLAHTHINFNGESGLLEIKEGEKVIQLNQNLYNRIEITTEGQKHVFINRVTPLDLTYYRAIYQSEVMQFLEKFESELKEEEVATYGASKFRSKFVNRTKSFLFKDGKLNEINRNNKKVVEFLQSPKLNSYLKKNKLNVKEDADLIKLLAYYESGLKK